MPAIVTTGRVFHHQPPSLWTFLAAGFEPGISGVYLVRSPRKLGALTTRPSCCAKMWSMPAIVTTGRNFSTIRPAYGLFWQQDSNLRISGVYLVRSPQKLGALTTRPSCCLKIWLTPAIVAMGRDFSTNRPAYGLFWQQDSNLLVSGVYLVRSPQRLGALTTRPSCCL